MRRHFILTHGRSGSNFVVNTLNLHPELVNYGEVLGDWTIPFKILSRMNNRDNNWEASLDYVYNNRFLFYGAQGYSALSHIRGGKPLNIKLRKRIKSIGVKDLVFLVLKRGLKNYLFNRPDIKVIYLSRRNGLNRYVSLLNMNKTGVVAQEEASEKFVRHVIDVEDLLNKLSVFDKENAAGEEIIERLPKDSVLSINYDDYFADEKSINRHNQMIFEHLGVRSIDVVSKHKKIIQRPMEEVIENYDSVVSALRDAGYSDFLKGQC